MEHHLTALKKVILSWAVTIAGLSLEQWQLIASIIALILSSIYTIVQIVKALRGPKDKV